MIRPGVGVLVLAVALAVTEAALRLGQAAFWRGQRAGALVSSPLLDDRLAALAAPHTRKRLLLLGDSVLAGSALREHAVPLWRARVVGARMAASPAWQGWDVRDFSADGLYPADLAALESAAGAFRPDAVAVELNYRMFCDAAGQSASAYSRPWLAARADGSARAPADLDQGLDSALAGACFVYRYAALARDWCWQPSMNDVLAAFVARCFPRKATGVPADALLLDLRIRPYYQAPAMGPGHLGLAALRALARDLRRRQVPVLVFLTPQNHARIDGMLDRRAWAFNRSAVAAAFAGPGLRFCDWSDRRPPGGFLDHCHPGPEGCGALADWITRELNP